MKLKFIGKDGSMGLEHGKVYFVHIYTDRGKIYVRWGPSSECPYSSPQALAANWMAAPTIIKSLRVTQVSLVPDAEPVCRITRESED